MITITDLIYYRYTIYIQIIYTQGDSGGPLFCEMDGRYVLQGVISSSSHGCDKNLASYYTKVTYFLPWIQATMDGMFYLLSIFEEQKLSVSEMYIHSEIQWQTGQLMTKARWNLIILKSHYCIIDNFLEPRILLLSHTLTVSQSSVSYSLSSPSSLNRLYLN